MKIKIQSFLFLVFFTIFFAGCNGQTKTKEKNQPRSDKTTSVNNNIDLQVPDFDDPALKQFYEELTYNIKKTVTAIRNKDEAALRNLYKESEKMREKENQIMAKAKHSPEDRKNENGTSK